MQIVINDILTNYTNLGEGKVIVLVHGWGDDSRTFDQLQSELSKKFRVYSLDLPGFGSSSMPLSAWTLDDFANFIKDFLLKLNESEIYCFIGHSNGGAILIKGLSSGIIKSEKLVLIATSGIRSRHLTRKYATQIVAKTGKVAVGMLPGSTRNKLKTKFYRFIGSDAEVAPAMIETFKNIVKDDVKTAAAKLNLPTLLIYGSDDKTTAVEFGKQFNKLIKGSQLEIIDGGGHFVHSDKFEPSYKAIEGFLNV